MPNLVLTQSGNNKEMVAHGLIYAPLAQMEFGNVSNTAIQKMLGGLVLSRAVLQSSTSATNFEISVGGNPIDADVMLTSTAVLNGRTTQIRAVVEYRPLNATGNRVKVSSWRVCAVAGC
jgi:hypothetical protein